MSEGLDLDKIRRSAEPGAMFGAIIVRDLVERLEQAEQAVARVREGHKRTVEYGLPALCEGCNLIAPCPTIRALDGDGRG